MQRELELTNRTIVAGNMTHIAMKTSFSLFIAT